MVSALANDPQRFLERNAKLQWGIMVYVYGMSHVPALLLLDFPGYQRKGVFLVFYLVFAVQTFMVRSTCWDCAFRATPWHRKSARAFSGRTGWLGWP